VTTLLRIWPFAILVAFALIVGFIGFQMMVAVRRSASIATHGGNRRRAAITTLALATSTSGCIRDRLARQEGLEPRDKTSRLDNRFRDCVRIDPHRIPLGHAPHHGGVHLLRPSPVVGTAGESDLGMQWTLVRGQTSRRVSLDDAAVSDLRTGMAGLIALGTIVALIIIGFFMLASYEAWWN
jgi:hypothetical protein